MLAVALAAPRLALAQPRSEREDEEDLRNLRLLDLNEGELGERSVASAGQEAE